MEYLRTFVNFLESFEICWNHLNSIGFVWNFLDSFGILWWNPLVYLVLEHLELFGILWSAKCLSRQNPLEFFGQPRNPFGIIRRIRPFGIIRNPWSSLELFKVIQLFLGNLGLDIISSLVQFCGHDHAYPKDDTQFLSSFHMRYYLEMKGFICIVDSVYQGF